MPIPELEFDYDLNKNKFDKPNYLNKYFLFCLQDPYKDGEAKIKQDYEELHEEMQQAFSNLEL